MATQREGDWVCPACQNVNFASRVACNRCSATRESYGVPGVTPAMGGGMGGAAGEMREGDWTCPSCQNHNYASRQACNRCGGSKTGGPDLGYGAMKAPMGGANRFNPMGGAAGRPGDWTCPSCQNHNYASREACNKCQTPKPMGAGVAVGGMGMGQQQNMGMGGMGMGMGMGMGAMMGGGAPNLRPGDWMCQACGNHNYASREACNKCSAPKDVRVANSGMRPGDWICPACSNHNYASKEVCNKCSGPKPAGLESAMPATHFTTPQTSTMREGDWMCPSCNNHNYASRVNCNKCQSPKGVYV